jgi:diadenosine tetraphosphate (Ap4A) HIT family hydrolase
MSKYKLHETLAADCLPVGHLDLCELLMMNDSSYPWFILVPRRHAITEIFQLNEADRQKLLKESCLLAETLQRLFKPEKLNIATIGNLVPQLHIHHIARFHDDICWPATVWGRMPKQIYEISTAETRIQEIRTTLEPYLINAL